MLEDLQISQEPDYPKEEINEHVETIWNTYGRFWDLKAYFGATSASQIGDYRYNYKLDDCSFEGNQILKQELKKLLSNLQNINSDQLSDAEKLNYQYLKEAIELSLSAQESFERYEIPTTHLFGCHTELPMLIKIHPFCNEKDVEDFITRLGSFSTQIQDVIQAFRQGIENKITLPLSSVEAMIKQCQCLSVEASQHPIYEIATTLEKFVKDGPKQLENVLSTKVIPSYEKLSQFLQDEYLSHVRTTDGIYGWKNGQEIYAKAIKYFTSLSLSAETIHENGLKEVERIENEMIEIQNQLEFQGTLKEFMISLQENPQFYMDDGRKIVEKYKDILKRADEIAPKYFGIFSSTPYDVLPVPSFREQSAPPAFYYPSPEDRSRPGTFFANTFKPETRPTYIMESIALHEAVPGHHIQISIAQELKNLPRLRKNVQGFCIGYVEGWGLYTERLGVEMKFYSDIYQNFGRLTTEMMRAIRLVVDTGLHHYGWTRQQCIDYFSARSAMSSVDIENEIDRYMVLPGQAVSYKVGELKLWELRHLAENELKEKFQLKEFHDVVLGNGALPLPTLESLVRNWIQTKQNST